MNKVNRFSPIPLYMQLFEDLKSQILNGNLFPGDPIPTEKELVEQYGVSRITIRQALGELRAEELIVSRQGKGTFVAPQKVKESLLVLKSFSEVIKQNGRNSTMKIKSFEFVTPDTGLQKVFNSTYPEEVLKIERIHCVENRNMAYAIIYLPKHIGLRLKESDVSNQSIYSLLENKFNLKLGQAVQHIQAITADTKLASILEIKKGSPLLVADRTTFTIEGLAIEKIRFYYPADQYEFVVNLGRIEKGTLWP